MIAPPRTEGCGDPSARRFLGLRRVPAGLFALNWVHDDMKQVTRYSLFIG
jgi:hypothetical protein